MVDSGLGFLQSALPGTLQSVMQRFDTARVPMWPEIVPELEEDRRTALQCVAFPLRVQLFPVASVLPAPALCREGLV
jgi:hypothetical protein